LDCRLRRKGHLKVVLRDTKVAKYFVGSGMWSGNVDEARDFGSSVWAIEAAMKMRQHELELLLLFSDPGHEISMPIGPLR